MIRRKPVDFEFNSTGRRASTEGTLQFLLFPDLLCALNDFFRPVIVLCIELLHIEAINFAIGHDHGFIIDMQ